MKQDVYILPNMMKSTHLSQELVLVFRVGMKEGVTKFLIAMKTSIKLKMLKFRIFCQINNAHRVHTKQKMASVL